MNQPPTILLVHPEISRSKYNFAGVIENEPVELETLSAALQAQGCHCVLWDGQVEAEPLERTLRRIQPDICYVCGRTRQERMMLEYCAAAKSICHATTVVGGIHAQLNPTRFFQTAVDVVVTTFDPSALCAIAAGQPLPSIDGICYPVADKWQQTRPRTVQWAQMPLPDRTYFYAHPQHYRYLELLPCAQIRTAYACPYHCEFCYRNALNGGVYTAKPIAEVVAELETIACENIYIIDDDFLVDCKRIRTFIRLVQARKLHKRFVCYGRADFIASHPALMRALHDIGFYYILVGLEAIDDRHLRQYHKRTDLSCNETALAILQQVGIRPMGMFILDLDCKRQDFYRLYRWIVRHNLKHVAISIFTPEFSTPQFADYQARLVTTDPTNWDYLHVVAKPTHLSVRSFYFHYHVLLIRLFLKGRRDGIYDFIDYGFYLRSFLTHLFGFGGASKGAST